MEETGEQAIEVPEGCGLPSLYVETGRTREGERRLIEAKNVSPVTYADLEHCFGEAYRELGRGWVSVNWHKERAEIELGKIKSRLLMGDYQDYMRGKPKYMDSGDMREAFLMSKAEYVALRERIAQMNALASMIDRKTRTMEKTCAYMKKRTDLILRSGVPHRP